MSATKTTPAPRRLRAAPPLAVAAALALVAALVPGTALAGTALAGTGAAGSPGAGGLVLEVLSSRPDQVSGDDALVRVRLPEGVPAPSVRVSVGGTDVTSAFSPGGHRSLTGLVTGLPLGPSTVRATAGRLSTELEVRNHPSSGPIFAGPRQYPFVCKTERSGLGQPLVDNADRQGMRVFAVDETGAKTDQVVGWSRDCAAAPRVDYLYRTTGGQFRPVPADGSRPADLARTTTSDGTEVDYVVRRERGTINRFLYSFAMLAPLGEDPARPDRSAWNRRVIFAFDGGVAIGHDQGTIGGSHLYDPGLSRGYAIIHSSGTRTTTHYNLILGGETALMTKEEFVERHGVPRYTVGVGGSGGAIQQYIYGQNHGNRVIDAAIPQYSYPDMVTQTIHVGDCELLEHYMDVTDGANPKWRRWDDRTWLEGMNASDTVPNPYRGGAPGSTECVEGWRGLTPLAMNPLWTDDNDPEWAIMDPPGVKDTVHWTHWDDLRNVYGLDETGFARQTWDNVGVQYGLSALTSGRITPQEFLDLNARVGSWRHAREMVPEGCPFVRESCADPAQFDPWSARNMRLSPDGGATPAPRRAADPLAVARAYESGLVFTGDIDIPVIDWRHYLEEELDMHNSHQSFASRQRMLDHDGDAGNQVIWFTDARPSGREFDQTPEALEVIDQWMARIAARPERGVAGNRPPLAVDRCFDTQGRQIAAGPGVWAGVLDDRPAGVCTKTFPLFGTSRTVAGGPVEGGVYVCHRQSVAEAISRGLYGTWQPTGAQRDRLERIFPTGVCDYTKGDAGRP